MKKITIRVLGIMAAFTLVIGIYSPTEKDYSHVHTLMEHGDGGG